MALLVDIQSALETAIESLGGTTTGKMVEKYFYFAARYVNQAVDGFILLRKEHRLDSAKLLIRPALETMLRLRAVHKKPHLVYRILFSETVQKDKWLSAATKIAGMPFGSTRDSENWRRVKAECEAQFGAENLTDRPLDAQAAAQAAGLSIYYDLAYRVYCQHTHGALEAATGNLDEFLDPEDSRTMVLCALAGLEAFANMGANCPDLMSLDARAADLHTMPSPRLIRQKPTE